MQKKIIFGSQEITATLLWHERKTMGIKVYPDGSVQVIAPKGSKEADILKKVKTRAPWILKQIQHFESFRPHTTERRFVNGESHLYLGRQYRLKIETAPATEVKAYQGRLILKSPVKEAAILRKTLDDWYKERATAVFESIMKMVLPRFQKYKIEKPVLVVRKMSARWGSCTPKGKIILNPELIKAPKASIEYVIVHELAHLVHHNHTKAFFNLQNRLMPDWKKWKDKLEHTLS